MSEGLGYLNTLWNQRDVYKQYTRQYFETEGMNVPGVCTLTGEPMGGWIQYSMSQTIGAWLAQHFYLHWQYSADEDFLREKAYPFVRDVAVYLEQISFVDQAGVRRLEFSSSPEIYDNSLNAWFKDMTNYDLSLMRFLFRAASEMATSLKLGEEAAHWAQLESQLPAFDLDKEGALTFAKGHPYNESHRHFSHALAIHPLGLIDWSNGEKDQQIILATLKKMKDYGPDYWTGYTYAWYANMLARAFKGEEAAEALRVFASCFCLKIFSMPMETSLVPVNHCLRIVRLHWKETLPLLQPCRKCCCRVIREWFGYSLLSRKNGKMLLSLTFAQEADFLYQLNARAARLSR